MEGNTTLGNESDDTLTINADTTFSNDVLVDTGSKLTV